MERNGQLAGWDARVRWAQRIANALWRVRHDGSDFSIVSNNCWGGAVYQGLRRPYASPFAGLFLMAPCYLKMLADLRAHLAHPPRRAEDSRYEVVRQTRGGVSPRYPIGLLGDDVEVHFLHYATWEEALDKWNRRTARIRWERLFVKFGDQNGSTAELVRAFLALPFERKICLTNRADVQGAGVVQLGRAGPTTRLQEDFEYRRHLDVPDWLCGGRTRGGSGLRKAGRWADARVAAAAARRAAVQQALGGAAEQTLDDWAAAARGPEESLACRR